MKTTSLLRISMCSWTYPNNFNIVKTRKKTERTVQLLITKMFGKDIFVSWASSEHQGTNTANFDLTGSLQKIWDQRKNNQLIRSSQKYENGIIKTVEKYEKWSFAEKLSRSGN